MIAKSPAGKPPGGGPLRRRLLEALRKIPAGHVTTFDALAAHLAASPAEMTTLIAHLTDDERQSAPWHRAVAKGGAIGRGPWRERQFALIVREGIPISPAGIVQDMARHAVTDLSNPPSPRAEQPAPATGPLSRSRGMKDRPGA